MVLQHAPPESPFARALSSCGHTADDHAYIAQIHVALIANWQRAGGKKSQAPKLPDCMTGEEREITRYGTRSMDLDDMAAWLGWDTPNMN